MLKTFRIELCIGLLLCVCLQLAGKTDKMSRIKYPGGKCYVYRYTLRDKAGTPYRLDHPQRWLSRESIERRKRQHLSLDSTDLPVSPLYLNQFHLSVKEARITGTTIVGTSRWNNTVLVRSQDTTLLNRFAHLDCVKSAHCVWTSPDSIERRIMPPKCRDEWNRWDSIKTEYYGNTKQQLESLRGIQMHNIGYKGKGMTIAILDGGFQNADKIPWFRQVQIEGVKDFVYPNSPNIYNETDHGTKVFSAMAVNEPYVYIGSAPEASYWLLRCEDQQTEQEIEEDYWAMAAEFADSAGVDIINSSLGYYEYDRHYGDHHLSDLDGTTALISRTASMLARKGIILVNSAGNTGMGSWKKITFPADAQEIISVGALTQEMKSAPFSAVGPTQDGRVKPDIMAIGSPATLISSRGTVTRDMGTSFSTPIVCGLVACLWQALPHKSALDIINLVRSCGDNHHTPNNIYGYGTPNFWRAYMIGRLE